MGGAEHLPGLLAGTADPVLLFFLVEAATLTDAVFPVHDLTLGVEEGERRAAMYAEVLGKLLVLGESGALLTRFLTHLAGRHPCRERWGDRKWHVRRGSFLLEEPTPPATRIVHISIRGCPT